MTKIELDINFGDQTYILTKKKKKRSINESFLIYKANGESKFGTWHTLVRRHPLEVPVRRIYFLKPVVII